MSEDSGTTGPGSVAGLTGSRSAIGWTGSSAAADRLCDRGPDQALGDAPRHAGGGAPRHVGGNYVMCAGRIRGPTRCPSPSLTGLPAEISTCRRWMSRN